MGLFGAAAEARTRWHGVTLAGGYGVGFGYSDITDTGRHRDEIPEPRTLEDYVRMPVVWGCVRIRQDRLGTMDVVTENKMPRWLKSPFAGVVQASGNIEPQPMPTQDLLAQSSASLDLAGNSWWCVGRDSKGKIGEVWVLHPEYVSLQLNERDGRYSFEFSGRSDMEIVVIPNFLLPNYPIGLSPIDYQRLLNRTSKGGQRQAESYFQNSSIIPGVISSAGNMTDDQMKLMRRTWRRNHSGPDRGFTPAYIGDGTWHSIGMSAEQAQFITSRQYTDAQIAAQIFGVDPTLLGLPGTGKSLTYTTLQSRETALQVEMQSVVKRIEYALTYLNNGKKVSLKPNIWTDEATRAKIYETHARTSKLLGAPIITVDEIREREGLPPLTDEQLIMDGSMLGAGSDPIPVEDDSKDRIAELEAQIAQLTEGNNDD